MSSYDVVAPMPNSEASDLYKCEGFLKVSMFIDIPLDAGCRKDISVCRFIFFIVTQSGPSRF